MKATFKSNITSVVVSGCDVKITCKDTTARTAVHSKIINNQSALGKYSKCSVSSNAVTYTFASASEANRFASMIDEVRETWKNVIIACVKKVEIYSKDWVRIKCDSKEIGAQVEPVIRAHITSLGFSYKDYVSGTTMKDFRYRFSSATEAARFLTVLEDIRNGKEVPVAMPFEEIAKDTTLAASRPNVVTTTTTPTATTSSGTTVKQTLPRATTTSAGTVVLQTATPAGSTSVEVTKEPLQEVQKKEQEKAEQEKTEQENGISKKTLLIAGGAAVLVIILLVIILKR